MARLTRRQRLLRLTSVAGITLLALSGLGAWLALRPPPARRPGEPVPGLTTALARELPPDHPRVEFRDVTASAGIGFRHFPATRSSQLPEDMGSGAAWGDFDGDGWLDLFIVNQAGPLTLPEAERRRSGARSALYRNRGDGSFEDVTERSGIDHRTLGMGAAWGDYDRDGRLDLMVSGYDHNTLYHNDGAGRFRDRTGAAGLAAARGFWTGVSWGDYDRDGWLDLYVTGYVRYSPAAALGRPDSADAENPASINPSSFPPERNLLYHNNGDGSFSERAAAAGVLDTMGRGLASTWTDFDEDGWPDLYVANDVSDNTLFRNLGNGKFADRSHAARVADYRSSMGIAVGDWDGDGDQDMVLTHWLAQENALYNNRLSQLRAGLPADSVPPLQFMDEADRYGLGQIALDFIGWGTSFFDYDNDGRLDLLVVNGSTLQRRGDPSRLVPMRHQLFWNRGAREGFYDVSAAGGPFFQEATVARGAAFADYDQDGDVDVLVVNHGGRPALLRNEGGNRRAWLQVELKGTKSNPLGIGAKLRLVAGGLVQVRQVGAQASYLSQNALREHFGLGDVRMVDTLEVRWPSGIRQVRTGLAANQRIVVVEAAGAEAPAASGAAAAGGEPAGRARITEFWVRYRRATALRLARWPADAAAAYTEALSLNPRHEDALYYLGSSALALGRFGEAESAWRRLAGVNPGSARAHSQLGALLLCREPGAPFDPAGAERELRIAHELNKEETGPVLQLGAAALLRGDPAGAEQWFAAVLGMNAGSAEAHFFRGYLAWRRGAAQEARQAFSRAVAAAAGSPSALPAGATSEGDTRSPAATGGAPAAGPCGALRNFSSGLAGIRQENLTRELTTRYRALDRWLAGSGSSGGSPGAPRRRDTLRRRRRGSGASRGTGAARRCRHGRCAGRHP